MMKLNKFLIFFLFISFQSKFLFSSEVVSPGDTKSGMAARQMALDAAEGKSGMAETKRSLAERKSLADVQSLDESESSENPVMWVQTSDAERPIPIPLEVAKLSSLLRDALEISRSTKEPISEKIPYPLPKASLITKAALELFIEISSFLKYGESKYDWTKYFDRGKNFLIEKLNSSAIEISTIFNLFNLAVYLDIPILMIFLSKMISEICANPVCLDYILKNINNVITNLGPDVEFELKKELFNQLLKFGLDYEIKVEGPLNELNEYTTVNSNNRFQADYDPKSNKISIYQIIDKDNKQKIFEHVYHPLIKIEWLDLNILGIIEDAGGQGIFRSIIIIPDHATIQNSKLDELLLIHVLYWLIRHLYGKNRKDFLAQNREKILGVIRNFTSFKKNIKYELIKIFELTDDIKKIEEEDKAKEEAELKAKQEAERKAVSERIAKLIAKEEAERKAASERIAEERAALIYRLLHKGS